MLFSLLRHPAASFFTVTPIDVILLPIHVEVNLRGKERNLRFSSNIVS